MLADVERRHADVGGGERSRHPIVGNRSREDNVGESRRRPLRGRPLGTVADEHGSICGQAPGVQYLDRLDQLNRSMPRAEGAGKDTVDRAGLASPRNGA